MNSDNTRVWNSKDVELPSDPSVGRVALGLLFNIVMGIVLGIGLVFGVIADVPIWILGGAAAVVLVLQRFIRHAITG